VRGFRSFDGFSMDSRRKTLKYKIKKRIKGDKGEARERK
jgi:hypothetical protein